MPWDYLQSPVLLVRQRIAAHFLTGSDRILEIGAFKTPITSHLLHSPSEVTIVDPLIEAGEQHELNGRPCLVRSLPYSIDRIDLAEWRKERFGLLFCGMDLNRQESLPVEWLNTVCHFLALVSYANPCILEYPLQWRPSGELFGLILSLLQPRIAADIRLDLRLSDDAKDFDEDTQSRFYRRITVLADMQPIERPADLLERAARILFGPQAAAAILGMTHGQFAEVPNGLALDRVQPGAEGALVESQDDAVSIQTPPGAWNFTAFFPALEEVISGLPESTATPGTIEIEALVEAGEIGFGFLHESYREITGERLIKTSTERKMVSIFVPDMRRHLGLICRNGQTDGVISKARIFKVSLRLLDNGVA
jgi:hypothetical protein